MVLNAAVQMLREADELKQKLSKFKSGTSMLQERSIWAIQQQLQNVYQKVLVLDLDYALDKKVEQDLWNVGFKQQIEALQSISKDRKNPHRSEGQAMLSLVLQAAAGFYLCLLHQICTTFKLDLPFRRRASLLGWVEGWGAGEAGPLSGVRQPLAAAARYICQHCLVHLGDLARYRQQLRVAHTFYRHAVIVSAQSGQPYNQLALVSLRRGRRICALYWHVRSLLVRAPFPPAADNLAHTLRSLAAQHSQPNKDLPVLPGVTSPPNEPSTTSAVPGAPPGRLDANSYVSEFIKALHLIHTVEELKTASSLVTSLNSSLTALVATDSFESTMLIKMACIIIWLVHSTTEDFKLDSTSLSESEALAADLSCELAAGTILALLLPSYTTDEPLQRTLPALKVWLQWIVTRPQLTRSAAWANRRALWAALAHTLNALPRETHAHANETVPLSEDEELMGFLPLEKALKVLRFHSQPAWDATVPRVPDNLHEDSSLDLCEGLSLEPGVEQLVRARRLIKIGKELADLRPEHLTYSEEGEGVTFSAASGGGEQLSVALEALSAVRGPPGDAGCGEEEDSDTDAAPPPPPVVISEADFREKVREKRVGILKPQGSLERAREERALATTGSTQVETPEVEIVEELIKSEDKKEVRKPRVNIAMAAIMRKQEETNKQVKFVTPPPTPDSTADTSETKEQDKPKVIQPKPMKSLADLPLGRKTGGILSLKDKSAGYPHLVNTDPEPQKKEKEEKKESKLSQTTTQSSQNYQQKRSDPPPSNWSTNMQNYNEPRLNFQKNYGIQNTGLTYNPNYQNINNQNIRLPVVNPKEIDVRTAALQKQNSRPDLFQDGSKFGHNYQVSGDKKNFLNDLPPRFANQFRLNWQNAQDNQFNDNKFRDDNFQNNTLFNTQQQPRSNWMPAQMQSQMSTQVPSQIPTQMPSQMPTQMPAQMSAQMPEQSNYQQMPWWKPDQMATQKPNFNFNPPIQPNYYSNMSSPYQSMPSYSQMQNNLGQKPDNVNQNYIQSAIGQPQIQTLQNLVASPNFNSSLSNFGSYAPTVGYDSSMYPQFGNKLGYQPFQMKMMDKPQGNYQTNKDVMDIGVGFGANMLDLQQRNIPMNFAEPVNELGAMKNVEPIGGNETASGEVPSGVQLNTYSLFSGAPETAAWGSAQRPSNQSLWSVPSQSPLERLLEQQKQIKPPPAPQ